MDLTKLESKGVVYDFTSGDLVPVADAICSEFSAFAEERSVSIAVVNLNYQGMSTFDLEKIAEIGLIASNNIATLLNYEIVLLSGGDTSYLLNSLEKAGIAKALKSGRHAIQCIAGISAGAIALSRQGIGTKDMKIKHFEGMGLLNLTVLPHADKHPERKQVYPEAIALGAQIYSGTYMLLEDGLIS